MTRDKGELGVRRFVIVLLVLTLSATARGSLGDDSDHIERLYGDPSARRLREDGSVAILYHKDRYYYFVVFENGVSVLEKYSRMDWRDLSPKEIDRFLKANRGGKQWTTQDKQQFRRSDGKAEAAYHTEDGKAVLVVRVSGTKINQ